VGHIRSRKQFEGGGPALVRAMHRQAVASAFAVLEGWAFLLPPPRGLFHAPLRLLGPIHEHEHGIGGRGAHLSKTAKGGAAADLCPTGEIQSWTSPPFEREIMVSE
jgi:hypothetical protein